MKPCRGLKAKAGETCRLHARALDDTKHAGKPQSGFDSGSNPDRGDYSSNKPAVLHFSYFSKNKLVEIRTRFIPYEESNVSDSDSCERPCIKG